MPRLLAPLATACLLAACAAAPAIDPPSLPRTVTLAPAAVIAVAEGATLAYEGADDSRCPQGVTCVWAGEIAYKFTLRTVAGAQSFRLTAAAPVFTASVAPALRVALPAQPEPPPKLANAPPLQHPVTITLARP